MLQHLREHETVAPRDDGQATGAEPRQLVPAVRIFDNID